MPKFIDMTGEKYGRLTVIEYIGKQKYRKSLWLCKCECGNYTNVVRSNLISGKIQSCGCIKREKTGSLNKIHGMRHTRLYRIWLNMKTRCTNPNYKEFDRYMGRGIKICKEWADDFMSFYKWAMSNGYADDLSIDRIDNDGDYEPLNCKWSTAKEQSQNRAKRRWHKRPIREV